MRIAFYAPIKPPDHPIPSGDRLIGGNLMKAMRLAKFEVSLASRFIAYSKRSDPLILETRKKAALAEARHLIDTYQAKDRQARPQIWLTYHPYCKAPDWLGPVVSRALNIPYVTVEACKTGQGDQWLPWRREAQARLLQADRHLWFKPMDRDYLAGLLGSDERLRQIPPFIDLEAQNIAAPAVLPAHWNPQTPVMVTTGMMRPGKKDRNFFLLAEILQEMQKVDWNLIIVGGGPQEQVVRAAFSTIDAKRLHWCGQVAGSEVAGWMNAADLFVWPGWKEPIGMVYLEAAFQGLPAVAFENMGVPLVVRHNQTGLLAPLDDLEVFRGNLTRLLVDNSLRTHMGRNARKFVTKERSMTAAVARLESCLSEF